MILFKTQNLKKLVRKWRLKFIPLILKVEKLFSKFDLEHRHK